MAWKPTIIIVVKRKLLYLIIMALAVFFGWWLYREPVIWINLPFTSTISGKKIVIDAGHGGIDPGTKSKAGLLEKEINLDIALKLKRHLSMVGVYCVMIRETDRDFSDSGGDHATKKRRDLSYRTRVANRSGADLYLSIHANSFPQSIYQGAQTFYKKSDPRSRFLAEAIQYHLVKRLGPNRRRARAGDYRVLNDTEMPGVMIEVGFLSNPKEAELLKDEGYQDRIAKAIFHGVVDYFSNRRRCPPKIEKGR
ncbi:MAG: N-acetylmuramoyl-L-alanine amidase [Bacteroidota bacterium]